MNNEDKILELLTHLVERQEKTEAILVQVQQEQVQMRIHQEEMRQEINERFDILETNMKFAWQDISILEKRIQQHEKEFHSAV